MKAWQRNRPAVMAAGWAVLFLLVRGYWALGGQQLLPGGGHGQARQLWLDLPAVAGGVLGILLALRLAAGRYRAWLFVLAWTVAGALSWYAVLNYLFVTVRVLLGEPLTPTDRYDALGYGPFWLLGGVLFAAAAVRLRSAAAGWQPPAAQPRLRVPSA